MQKIIIGSDHAGFALKETIRAFLAAAGWDVADYGTHNDAPVDYPDFGCPVAEKVSSGEYERGILVCGSGVGMAIVANKYAGVRAVLCLDEETARSSRMHNDANVLALAGRRTDAETAKQIVLTWLNTPFEGGRHQGRIDKIARLEKALCPGSDNKL